MIHDYLEIKEDGSLLNTVLSSKRRFFIKDIPFKIEYLQSLATMNIIHIEDMKNMVLK